MGIWIITGHAVLEMGIILFLLLGFSFVLKNPFIVRSIGILGGVILLYFGISIIRDVIFGKIPTSFLDSTPDEDMKESAHSNGFNTNEGLQNPVVGGALVSMANPYWWVWWATIGFAFMVQFDVTLQNGSKLFAFFIGHEAGDLIWYVIVSSLTFFGFRYLNKKVYYSVLVFCGMFMIFFGLYLGLSPFFEKGTA